MIDEDSSPTDGAGKSDDLLRRLGEQKLNELTTQQTFDVVPHPEVMQIREWLDIPCVRGKFDAAWPQRLSDAKQWRIDDSGIVLLEGIAAELDRLFPENFNTFSVFDSRRPVVESDIVALLKERGKNEDETLDMPLEVLAYSLKQIENPRQDSTTEGEKDAYIFRKEHDTWTLRFDGGEVERGIKEAKVLEDLNYLLRRPTEEVNLIDLPNNRDLKPRAKSVGVATDGDLKHLLEQIVSKTEELKTEIDILVLAELKSEIAALQKQKNENFDNKGNPRQLSGDRSKMRRRTKLRVSRFLDPKKEIWKKTPELRLHLASFVTIDYICTYEPETEIEWHLGD